jgi:ABC-2 type transport system ATP-binding protein
MERAIVTEGLTKIFSTGGSRIVAVDHVDLEVDEGEIFGLLGPNGAGKTTTIRMLTTLLKPTEGKAWVFGFNVLREQEEVRRRISWVSSDVILDDDLKGIENMMIQARLYHLPIGEARRRAWELLDMFGLRDAGNRYVKEYSTGMRKRLEVAMALLPRPRVIFMDEPTVGLDVNVRRMLWGYIRRIVESEGVTIFLTTHYMEEAEELCNRVAFISRGKVVAVGRPEELRKLVGGDVIIIEYLNEVNGESAVFLESMDYVKDVKVEGTRVRVSVERAEDTLPRLMGDALKLGPVARVTVQRPNLEAVFIYLTGQSLTEDQSGSRSDYYRTMFRVRRARG